MSTPLMSAEQQVQEAVKELQQQFGKDRVVVSETHCCDVYSTVHTCLAW
jgi:hypothetical protein